jgi:hypothetical protein
MTSQRPGAAPAGNGFAQHAPGGFTVEETRALNRRYSLVGWGALFVWIGAVAFLPGERVPFGLGLLGIGVILLGINLARRAIHALPVNGTDITLGTIALALGVAELVRSLVVIPIGLIAIGLVLLVRSGLPRKTATTASSQDRNTGDVCL